MDDAQTTFVCITKRIAILTQLSKSTVIFRLVLASSRKPAMHLNKVICLVETRQDSGAPQRQANPGVALTMRQICVRKSAFNHSIRIAVNLR